MADLSRIRPKLRTSGSVTGNFGRAKTKAGSPLRDIGITNSETVTVTKPEEYLARLYRALDIATDSEMRSYLFHEIRNILIKQGKWEQQCEWLEE